LSRRLEGEPRLLQRELASMFFHRLSPLHNRLPPEPKPPPDAEPGWIVARSRRLRGVE
jgi:hypothetical protein